MTARIPLPFAHGPRDVLGYRANGTPIYPIAGGAYTDPPAGGIASDNVSPVTASQTPEGKLLSVGTRDGAGIPTGTAGLQSLVTKAYDLIAYKVLRKRLLFDPIATVRTTNESHQGAAVQFNFVGDIDDDPTKALLVEDHDVLPTPFKSWSNSVLL